MLSGEELGGEPFEEISGLKYSELEDSDMFRSYETSLLDTTLSADHNAVPPPDVLMAALADGLADRETKFAQHLNMNELKQKIIEGASTLKGTLISLADIVFSV